MKSHHAVANASGILLLALAGAGWAQGKLPADFGKREFQANCVRCHGATGKGNGPYADFRKLRIPDLGTLSARNKGVFPYDDVYQVIEGSGVVSAHRADGMPAWGEFYTAQAFRACKLSTTCDTKAYVRERILALTEYVYTLKAK
jgi:mono/diheme cytochrome c family protein